MAKPLCLKPPSLAGCIEYSVHTCSNRLRRELADVFEPSVAYDKLLIVPTFQLCSVDLVEMGAHAEAEKNSRLETFNAWAKAVCAAVAATGNWADYTDPCSGLPALGERFTSTYPDVLGAQALLRYDVIDTGCCKVLAHPRWGTKIYPGTLFTTAPLDVLLAAIDGPS